MKGRWLWRTCVTMGNMDCLVFALLVYVFLAFLTFWVILDWIFWRSSLHLTKSGWYFFGQFSIIFALILNVLVMSAVLHTMCYFIITDYWCYFIITDYWEQKKKQTTFQQLQPIFVKDCWCRWKHSRFLTFSIQWDRVGYSPSWRQGRLRSFMEVG